MSLPELTSFEYVCARPECGKTFSISSEERIDSKIFCSSDCLAISSVRRYVELD